MTISKSNILGREASALGEKYQLQEKARHLKEQFARKWFGITARQSSLNHVVQWVEILLNEKPSLWKGQGKLLLDLCRQLDSESNLVADYAVSVVMWRKRMESRYFGLFLMKMACSMSMIFKI